MMKNILFFVLLGVFISVTVSQNEKTDNEKRIVCYYTNWSGYRPGNTKFSPSTIDPNLCTHLIYAFAKFSTDNGLAPGDEYQDITNNGFQEFNKLKEKNDKLKTLLSLGGWSEGSETFSNVAASPDKRAHFTKSVIQLLRKFNFDGINLDWQYPCFRSGSRPEDKQNYVKLVEDLRNGFEEEAKQTNRSSMLITASVPSETEYIEQGFDLLNLQKYTDHMNILSYDYHVSSEPYVAHHSPLYPLYQDVKANNTELCADSTVQYLLNKGLKKERLNLGIPAYGRSFKLKSNENHGLGASSKTPGNNEEELRIQFRAYYDLCKIVKDENWTVEHTNNTVVGPFAYKDDNWIGYDDESSTYEKGKYAREKGLGGIMFWTVDNDDYLPHCGSQRFPLITAGRKGLLNQ